MSTEIFKKIPAVMADIGAVEKNRKNEQQKYSFRGIEDFYAAAHPAFVKHGIFCVPEVLEREATSFDRTNDYGKVTTWHHIVLKVRHRFYAEDGSYVDAVTVGEGLDNSDKASNKAMSGAMKYAFIELFSVPTQDVEDADRTTPEAGRQRPVKRVAEDIEIGPPATKAAAKDTAVKGGTPEPKRPETFEREPGADDEDDIDAPISLEKQRNLHRAFREATREHLRHTCENVFRDWLKNQGFVDDESNGSTKRIPQAMFAEVKAKAIEFAKGLK